MDETQKHQFTKTLFFKLLQKHKFTFLQSFELLSSSTINTNHHHLKINRQISKVQQYTQNQFTQLSFQDIHSIEIFLQNKISTNSIQSILFNIHKICQFMQKKLLLTQQQNSHIMQKVSISLIFILFINLEIQNISIYILKYLNFLISQLSNKENAIVIQFLKTINSILNSKNLIEKFSSIQAFKYQILNLNQMLIEEKPFKGIILCFLTIENWFLGFYSQNLEYLQIKNKLDKQQDSNANIVRFIFKILKHDDLLVQHYLDTVKIFLKQNIDLSLKFSMKAIQITIKLWQQNLYKQHLKNLLIFCKNSSRNYKYIINLIVNSNIQDLFTDYMDILTELQYMSQQLEIKLFLQYLPVCINNLQLNKKLNISLFNKIIRWKIRNFGHFQIEHLKVQQIFQKFTSHISQENIILFYKEKNTSTEKILTTVIKNLKYEKSINFNQFQKRLFSNILSSNQKPEVFQNCLQTIILFHMKISNIQNLFNFFQILTKNPLYQYPTLNIRCFLRKCYQKLFINLCKNNKFTHKLIYYIIQAQSVLDIQLFETSKLLKQSLYKITFSQSNVLSIFYQIFDKFSSKTSLLCFLNVIFNCNINQSKNNLTTDILKQYLEKLKNKLQFSKFSVLNCYSSLVFLELLYIYNLKQIYTEQAIPKIITDIILIFLPYVQFNDIFNLFQTCKFDYLADCLNKRKQLLKILGCNPSKAFLAVNQRFQRFIQLYEVIIKKYNIQNAMGQRSIVKYDLNSKQNLIIVTQNLQNSHNFNIKLKFYVNLNSINLGFTIKLKIAKSYYQLSITDQFVTFKTDIKKKQVKIIDQIQPLTIQLSYLQSKKSLKIMINHIQKPLTIQSVENAEMNIEIQLFDSYLTQIQVNRNLKNNIKFDLNQSIEYKNNVWLKISQVEIIQTGLIKQYLQLKYLFTLFHQMTRNDTLDGLHNIYNLYNHLLQIIFFNIQNNNKNQQYQQTIFLLQKLSRIFSQHQYSLPIQTISNNLKQMILKYNQYGQIVFNFTQNILLNFQIWNNCYFQVQLKVILTFKTLLNTSQQFKKHCIASKIIYKKLVDIGTDHFNLNKSDTYKGISIQQCQLILQQIQDIKNQLVGYNNFKYFEQKIKYILSIVINQNGSCEKSNRNSEIVKKKSEMQQMVKKFIFKNIQISRIGKQRCLKDIPIKNRTNLLELYNSSVIKLILEYNINQQLNMSIYQILLQLLGIVDNQQCMKLINILSQTYNSDLFINLFNRIKQLVFLIENKMVSSIWICKLMDILLRKYDLYNQQDKQAILAIIKNYMTKLQNASQQIKIKFLIQQNTILFMTELITVNNQQQAKVIVSQYFKLIFQVKKQHFLNFNNILIKYTENNIQFIQTYLNNLMQQKNKLYITSLSLQYCIQFIIKINQPTQFNFDIILEYIEYICYKQQDSVIYYVYPNILFPDSQKILNRLLNQKNYLGNFQMRGGIFFKLLFILFKICEYNPCKKILQIIQFILIKNLELTKKKINRPKQKKAFFDFIMSDSKVSNTIAQAIKRSNLENQQFSQKYDKQIGKSAYQKHKTNKNINEYCLEYAYLKLQIISIRLCQNVVQKQIYQKLDNIINSLKKLFPCLKSEYNIKFELQRNKDLLTYFRFKTNYILAQQSFPMTPLTPLTPIGMENTITHPFSDTALKFKTPIKQDQVIQGLNINVKQFMPKQQIRSTNNIRYGRQLIKLEYLYTYEIQCEQDFYYVQMQKKQKQLSQIFLQQMLKQRDSQNLRNMIRNSKMNYKWENLVRQISKEQDGVLYQKLYNNKQPILKLRNIQLFQYQIRPITKLTTKYDYKIQTQVKLDKQTKDSLLYSYSIVKRQSFLMEKPKYAEDIIKQQIQQVNQQCISVNFQCQYVTRIGIYFGNLQVNLKQSYFFISTNKQGRPDKQQFKYGSAKNRIIKNKVKRRKIYFFDIIQIQSRKFCQTYNNSIEIFTKKGKSYFFMLYSQKNNKVFFKILKNKINQNYLVQNCQQTFKKRKYTQKWQNNQLSNFDYLMLINKFSGRSYNDPNQAYIFPWILSDYTSKQIDLTKPGIYRDLKYPIGAINPAKFKKNFFAKYSSQNPHYYGMHFSNPMLLSYYLIRLEPYTSLARELQSGNFDAADRLFFSIPRVWDFLMAENVSDVRQLIPQFYYLPTFLQNTNRIKLGQTQNGIQVKNVQLPNWANNDTHLFINIMKNALESDFVSSKLNLWIDLVFGNHQNSKQRHNIYESVFYHQNINFQKFKDCQLDGLIIQICQFGQFPIKLFKKDHPQKTKQFKLFSSRSVMKYQKKTQILERKIVQQLRVLDKKILFKIKQSKSLKYYFLQRPFLNFTNKLQISEKDISFQHSLFLKNIKTISLYMKTQDGEVFLKQITKIKIPYKKYAISSNFIALCGDSLIVIDYQGKQYYKWDQQQVLDAVFIKRSIFFITKTGKLNKYDFVTKFLEYIYQQGEKIRYQASLIGFEDKLDEVLVLCLDKKKIIYIVKEWI